MGLMDYFRGLSGSLYEQPPDDPGEVNKEELSEQQAKAAVSGEREVWQSQARFEKLTPGKLAQILSELLTDGESDEYLELAHELEIYYEPHYRQQLGIRKDAVLALPVQIDAASEAAQDQVIAAELRQALLDHEDWDDLLRDLLDGLGKGYAAAEIIWQAPDTSWPRWRPDSFLRVDPRWLRYYKGSGRILGLRQEGKRELLPLLPHKYIIHEPHLVSSPPILTGLALPVLYWAMLKRFTINQWAQFLERFGKPFKVGKYPRNARPESIRSLKKAVAAVGSSLSAVVPVDMEIAFTEAKNTGSSSDSYDKIADRINKEISKLVLHQTMSSEDGSSKSQAEVHDIVRNLVRDADARALAKSLQYYVVRSYVQLNYPPGTALPKIRIEEVKTEDSAALVGNVAALVPLGLQVSAAELRERLGLRAPQEGEAVLSLGKPESTVASQEPQKNARQLQLNREVPAAETQMQSQKDTPDAVDQLLSDIAESEYEEITDALLEPLRKAAADANDFAEFKAKLAGLGHLHPNADALATNLAIAQFKALVEGSNEFAQEDEEDAQENGQEIEED